MSGFMIGGNPFLFFSQNHALPFGSHQNLVFSHLEIDGIDFGLVLTSGPQRGLVDQIFEIGS